MSCQTSRPTELDTAESDAASSINRLNQIRISFTKGNPEVNKKLANTRSQDYAKPFKSPFIDVRSGDSEIEVASSTDQINSYVDQV